MYSTSHCAEHKTVVTAHTGSFNGRQKKRVMFLHGLWIHVVYGFIIASSVWQNWDSEHFKNSVSFIMVKTCIKCPNQRKKQNAYQVTTSLYKLTIPDQFFFFYSYINKLFGAELSGL